MHAERSGADGNRIALESHHGNDAAQVLIVEDDPGTAELERRTIERMGLRACVVSRANKAIAQLANDSIVAVLLDYYLADGDALPVVQAARAAVPPVPVVVVTGLGDESLVANLIRLGVSDYLIKGDDFLSLVPSAVSRAISLAEAERIQGRLAAIVESSHDAIIGTRLDGTITSWNPGAARCTGHTAAEAIGHSLGLLATPACEWRAAPLLDQVAAGESISGMETVWLRKDGTSIDVSVTMSPIRDKAGRVIGVSVAAHDISERKRRDVEITQRLRQQAAVASLGKRALQNRSPLALARDASTAIAETLEVPLAEFLEVRGESAILRAGIGWNDGDFGRALAAGDTQHVVGQALEYGAPVIFNDATAVNLSAWVQELRVRSGVIVTVPGRRRKLGVLGAYSTRPRAFSNSDANFLQAVANVLAAAIEQHEAQELLLEKARLAALAADVAMAHTGGDTLRGILQNCCDAMVRQLGVAFARIWTLNSDERVLELQASAGLYTHIDGDHSRVPVGKFKIGLIAQERAPHLTNDVLHDPRIGNPDWARREGMIAFAGYPLMVEQQVVGVMGMFARARLTDFALEALATVADTIALGIERKLAEAGRAKLEEQLRQSQKMEAIGQLAGGVAHDFNNLLTVIMGYGEMLESKLGPADPRARYLTEIRKAATRASALTRHLLAFSRQQVLRPTVLNVNEIVAGLAKMLERLIGEAIQLEINLSTSLASVKADAGQIEQVLMNLVVNSRDAMPEGGTITIATSNTELDGTTKMSPEIVEPGRYVLVSVTDTGTGMDAATRARIFEPFFTTKPPGKGTGLGLATVYGIVKQSGGHVWVYSELGHGSTFKIYLPYADAANTAHEIEPKTVRAGNGESILLVEDDGMVRGLATQLLEDEGYDVVVAENGAEALRMAEQHDGPLHLLLTDVVMPGGSGREWAERIVAIRPDLKVLYMSGYPDDTIAQHRLLEGNIAFLQKPFTGASLSQKVREVLDAVPGEATCP